MASSDLREHWDLDPAVVHLNHGAFGACPRVVLEEQARLRAAMESRTMSFFVRDYETLLDRSREHLAGVVGADSVDLAFVTNATSGVNAVLRSIVWSAGDELLVTDQAYNACRNALEFVAERWGARVVVVSLPFPLVATETEAANDELTEAVLAGVTPATKLALLDHVTSPTGIILPIERLVAALAEQGVETLVDGAHAPGMVPVDLSSLGAAYYTANCHKWLCAPKGSAFLWVRRDRQATVRPLTISHGANSRRTDKSRFQLEFDWTGTFDPTAVFALPTALGFLDERLPGGMPAVAAANHALVLTGRDTVMQALGVPPPCPEGLLGSLAAMPLPDDVEPRAEADEPPVDGVDRLQVALMDEGIDVPVHAWPRHPQRVLRISAQLYNQPSDYADLATALRRRTPQPSATTSE